MNKRHYEHTLPNIRGSLSNTYCYFTNFQNITKYYPQRDTVTLDCKNSFIYLCIRTIICNENEYEQRIFD